MTNTRSAHPNRILIIRFSSAGDIVLCSAFLRCVRRAWPKANIDMLVRSDLAELVAGNPHIDSILRFERAGGLAGLLRLARNLRSLRYDLLIDLHGNGRSRLLKWLIRPTACVGIKKHSLKRLLLIHAKWKRRRSADLMMKRYFEPIRPYGIVYDEQGTEIHISSDKKKKIAALLTQFGDRPIVGLAPGASYPKKAFPLNRMEHIAQRILKETPACVILFGGAHDPKLKMGDSARILDLQGKADMQEAAAAAGFCRVMLANDSLMLHLAEAAGTDTVALFGPTTYHFGYAPWRAGSVVVQTDLPCRPCSKHGQGRCGQKEQYCFTRIDSNVIFEEIKKRLTDPKGIE